MMSVGGLGWSTFCLCHYSRGCQLKSQIREQEALKVTAELVTRLSTHAGRSI